MIISSHVAIQNVMDDVAWTDWSPTWSAASGTLTSVTTNSAKYRTVGKYVEFFVSVTTTDIGTASADLRFTLPVTAAENSGFCGRNQSINNLVQGMNITTHGVMWTVTNGFPAANGNTLTARGRYRIA